MKRLSSASFLSALPVLMLLLTGCGGEEPAPTGPSCATTYGGCDLNAECADTSQGMTCTCRPGFTGDGKTCQATSPVLSSGDAHTCGLWPDGALRCWGSNESGQLGDGSFDSTSTGTTVGTNEWQSVSAAGRHTVAVKKDGSMWWWGWDYQTSRLSTSRRVQRRPTRVGIDSDWAKVTSSEWQICGLKTSGSISCRPSWGGYPAPAVTDPTDPNSKSPDLSFKSFGSDAWRSIGLGEQHLCAVKQDGTLWCWGVESQTHGVFTRIASNPVQVNTDTDWREITAGGSRSCALKNNGTLWCWDHSYLCFPCLGSGPQQVGSSDRWASLSVDGSHICATQTNGSLWCWGENESGQLGTGTTDRVESPVQVGAGAQWVAASSSNWHTCGVQTDNSVWCWGRHEGGPSSIEAGGDTKSTPVKSNRVRTGQVAVTTGEAHSCAIDGDGAATCWGRSLPGFLCSDAMSCSRMPRAVSGDDWTTIQAGNVFTCGLKESGSIACWGTNDDGELGNGSTDGTLTPVPIARDTTWTSLAVRDRSSCGIDSTGGLWCWGANENGQLGIDEPMTTATPLQVQSTIGWRFVAPGYTHSCGIKADGTLWCWGDNSAGQLGLGDESPVSTTAPMQVGTDTDWSSVSPGLGHTCAMKEAGTLWCWGDNSAGQLGINSFLSPFKTPQQVPSTFQWLEVSSGQQVTCAIQHPGTLWCWGSGSSPVLSATGKQLSPVQVGNDSSWSALSVSLVHACALRGNGVVWCWGSNRANELGDVVEWGLTPERVAP